MHWVMVGDLGTALGLHEEVLDAAVQQAIAKGWLIGEGKPPHSVCISSSVGKMAELS
jgi:hypothetical protein